MVSTEVKVVLRYQFCALMLTYPSKIICVNSGLSRLFILNRWFHLISSDWQIIWIQSWQLQNLQTFYSKTLFSSTKSCWFWLKQNLCSLRVGVPIADDYVNHYVTPKSISGHIQAFEFTRFLCQNWKFIHSLH